MNPRELAAAYLLDDLDAGGRERVERRLAEDAELRAEVEAMRPIVGGLQSLPADAWPEEDGHAGAEGAPGGFGRFLRLGNAKGARTQAGRDPGRHPAPPGRRWSLRPTLAVCVVLAATALGVGAGLLLGGGSEATRPVPPAIVLRPLEPTAGESATVAMPRAGEMVLRARGLPPSAEGQYYELWLMTDAERTVPVASFRVGADGRATLRVPLPADPGGYRYFDLSRQNVAAGTQHSADSVLRGPTA